MPVCGANAMQHAPILNPFTDHRGIMHMVSASAHADGQPLRTAYVERQQEQTAYKKRPLLCIGIVCCADDTWQQIIGVIDQTHESDDAIGNHGPISAPHPHQAHTGGMVNDDAVAQVVHGLQIWDHPNRTVPGINFDKPSFALSYQVANRAVCPTSTKLSSSPCAPPTCACKVKVCTVAADAWTDCSLCFILVC